MPKIVSKRTAARKRTQSSKQSGSSSSKQSEERRRGGIELLNDWSDKHVPVELMACMSGIKIMGNLVKLQMSPDHNDFMFKTPFGIVATVFTLIYDDIHVDDLLPNAQVVFLSMSRFPEDDLRLEAIPSYAASTENVKAAGDVFDAWVKENAKLIVTIGDDMRISACICEMTKAGDSAYMLTDNQAKTIHMVFPDESGIIVIEHHDSGAEVTLHNLRTNSHIKIRCTPKGAMESPEELLARYPLANRFVH